MQQTAFEPSERARSCVHDRDVPDHLVARDPLLTLAEKQWVLQHRLGDPHAPEAAQERYA